MDFEQEIRKLCEQIVACNSDDQAVGLARRMKELVHAHVEECRGNLTSVPPVGPVSIPVKENV